MAMIPAETDFSVENHGSIFILNALSQDAKDWVAAHLPEDVQTWGANGYVVEHRYIDDILAGIERDGYTITA